MSDKDLLIDRFVDCLNQFLLDCVTNSGLDEEIVSQFESFFNSPVNPREYGFKCYVNHENGCKSKGDFSVHLPPKLNFLNPYLTQFCDQLVVNSVKWDTFSVIKYNIIDSGRGRRIQLFICRQTAAQRLVEEFCDLNSKTHETNCYEKCLIVSVNYETKNRLTRERLERVSQSVSKLMNKSCVYLNYSSITDELFESLLTFAQNSDFCETCDRRLVFKDNTTVATDNSDISKPLIIDKTSKLVFEMMWNLHELVENDIKSTSHDLTIVAVISESLSYRLSQSFRLMCLLYKLDLHLKLIPVSNVNCSQSYDDYLRSVSNKLMEQNTDSSDISADNFETLIDTSIALSLLTTRPSLLITRLEPYLSEATFIQYNCGRLKAIISRYDRQYVAKGIDSPIDLSLLTHDLEWGLVFNNFSKFKSIISANVEINSTSSQLVLFLKEFVRDVSVYYKKVKVLTEPSPHLKALIATRVHFCRLILQLVTNCLHILGLKTVDYL